VRNRRPSVRSGQELMTTARLNGGWRYCLPLTRHSGKLGRRYALMSVSLYPVTPPRLLTLLSSAFPKSASP